MIGAASIAALLGAALLGAAAPDDAVRLRSGETISGVIESVDPGGLSLRRPVDRGAASAGGGAQAVDRFGWDRIAAVEAQAGPQRWPALEALLDEGSQLWRARIRLERGDARLAATALRSPWVPRSPDGPTSATAAMIELQVALAAQDRARAAAAFLEALRLRRRGFEAPSLEAWLEPSPSGSLVRRELFDGELPLSPVLPPVAADDAEREAMLAAIDAFDPRGDAELDELRRAFAAAIEPSRAPAAPPPSADGSDRADEAPWRQAMELLTALRAARGADAQERARGRDALASMRRRLPEWAEAWARFAAGDGLLTEGSPESLRAAQMELLHLPARFAESQPLLAPLAAARAAKASLDLGHADEASRIDPAHGGRPDDADSSSTPTDPR